MVHIPGAIQLGSRPRRRRVIRLRPRRRVIRLRRRRRRPTVREFFFGSPAGVELQMGTFGLGRGAAFGALRFAGRAARGIGRGVLKIGGVSPFKPLRLGLALPAVGALAVSPKLRRRVVRAPGELVQAGAALGERFEAEGVERGGLFAGLGLTPLGLLAGAGLGLLGGAIIPTVGSFFRGRRERAAETTISILQAPAAAGLPGAAGVAGAPGLEPIGAVQPPIEEPKEPVEAAMQPLTMPSIRITNKPEINIRFSKSKRFINQQVLVKQ